MHFELNLHITQVLNIALLSRVVAQDSNFTVCPSDHDGIPFDDITKPHFRQTTKPNSVR